MAKLATDIVVSVAIRCKSPELGKPHLGAPELYYDSGGSSGSLPYVEPYVVSSVCT